VQGVFKRGMTASRDLTKKARGKAKELSAMGVAKLEIMQLESDVEKLIAKLGKELKEMEYRAIGGRGKIRLEASR
jgi:hypothetical protein